MLEWSFLYILESMIKKDNVVGKLILIVIVMTVINGVGLFLYKNDDKTKSDDLKIPYIDNHFMESKNRDYVLNLLEEMIRFKHKIEITNEISSISTANRFIVVQKPNYVFIKDFESSFVLKLNS